MHYETPQLRYVSGDWHWNDADERYDKVYPALVTGYWNGWAVPLVDHATAQRVVKDQAHFASTEDAPTLEWDHLTIVYRDPGMCPDDDPEDAEWRVHPDPAGLYDIGFGWTWTECNEDGTVPVKDTGEDNPAAPSAEQIAALTEYNERAAFAGRLIFSGNAIARDDGVHVFPLSLWNGKREGNVYHSTRVAEVHIARDGSITLHKV